MEPVGQWIMKPNAKEFHLYFKIFRFEETNELRITCVVRGCTSWDSPSCSIVSGGGKFTPVSSLNLAVGSNSNDDNYFLYSAPFSQELGALYNAFTNTNTNTWLTIIR